MRPLFAKTIGIVRVSRWTAMVGGVVFVRIISGCTPTNSCASARVSPRGLGRPSPIRAGGRATWQAVAVCGADQYVAQSRFHFGARWNCEVLRHISVRLQRAQELHDIRLSGPAPGRLARSPSIEHPVQPNSNSSSCMMPLVEGTDQSRQNMWRTMLNYAVHRNVPGTYATYWSAPHTQRYVVHHISLGSGSGKSCGTTLSCPILLFDRHHPSVDCNDSVWRQCP